MLPKTIVFRNFFVAAGILSLLSMAGIVIVQNYLPPLLPVYYGKPTGIEQLASTYFIFIIPGTSIIITAINLFFNTATKDVFIKKTLAIVSLAVSFMATITVFKIILLVGFF